MIQSKTDLKYFLSEDLKRYDGIAPNLKDWFLHNESWYIYHLIKHLRYLEYYKNCKGAHHPLFYWHLFRYKRLSFLLHITIYPNTVGPGLRIYHTGGFIHVGPKCNIGKHCTLLPGVVFGNKYEKESDSRIVVGDNCYFGLGVKVFGPVNIGDNVQVGANAVVTHDIPDNVIVGGVPAKILRIKNL